MYFGYCVTYASVTAVFRIISGNTNNNREGRKNESMIMIKMFAFILL